MHDILHDFFIEAKPIVVYKSISTSSGLNKWWTLDAEGIPENGALYKFYFGPKFNWKGKVTTCIPSKSIEWEMIECDLDWNNTKVGFNLADKDGGTFVNFYHKNWPSKNEHFRQSSYCWATYLRLLKRHIEHGEFVPYDHRISA